MRTPGGRMRSVGRVAVFSTACVAVASCGSRTGLFGEEDYYGTTTNGPHGINEAGTDTRLDTGQDVLPPIDVVPKPDVDRTDCPDADATYIYVVTAENELFSFYPPDLTFKFIGNLVCPSSNGTTPFSMAVDRRGVAYVLYDVNGELYRVSTATAACVKTSFVTGQQGFQTFGMGFASDVGGAAERLYVSDNDLNGSTIRGLGWIDTMSFKLSFIGSFGTEMKRSELTGTGDGRLFAYWPNPGLGGGSHLTELNKATGQIVAQTNLPIGQSRDAFAFAFWGGDFWIFTSSGGGGSTVNQFRPMTGTTTQPTKHPSTIVGAGVSTCAPQL